MKILKFIFALLLSFVPAVFGILWTPGNGDSSWYQSLAQPMFTPPNWTFSVVWTTLYLLLAVAFYLVLKSKNESKNRLLSIELFFLHLILNASWSYIFFGQHMIEFGAILIIVLILIGFMMRQEFKKINKYAGILVIPYITWLFCALYLNMGIYFLN